MQSFVFKEFILSCFEYALLCKDLLVGLNSVVFTITAHEQTH